MVICPERSADLHMAQMMPLPFTVSCFSKIQTGLPFWYRLTWIVPDKGPLNVCVCVCLPLYFTFYALPCMCVFRELQKKLQKVFRPAGTPAEHVMAVLTEVPSPQNQQFLLAQKAEVLPTSFHQSPLVFRVTCHPEVQRTASLSVIHLCKYSCDRIMFYSWGIDNQQQSIHILPQAEFGGLQETSFRQVFRHTCGLIPFQFDCSSREARKP